MNADTTEASIESTVLSNGKQKKPFVFSEFLYRRTPLILFIGITVTIIILAIVSPFHKKIYKTDGVLWLDTTKQITVAGREQDAFPGQIRDYLRTMVQRINTPDVLIPTLLSIPKYDIPQSVSSTEAIAEAAIKLQKQISVKEILGTNLISLSIESESPQGIALILNRLMETFVEKNQKEKRRLVEGRINYLSQEREKIIARQEENKIQWKSIVSKLPNETFVNPGYTGHMSKLEISRKLFLEAQAKSDELEKKYQEALNNRKRLIEMDLKPLADEKTTDNFGITRMELWTYEQSAALRRTIDGLTVGNQDRKTVEDRLKSMDDYLDNYRKMTSNDIAVQLKEKQKYDLDLAVNLAKSAASTAAAHAKALEETSIEILKEHNDIASGIFDLIDLEFNNDQLKERLKGLNARIDDAEVEAMTPVQIYIDRLARTPTEANSTNFKVLLLISLALGFGGVGSFILAFDLVDDRLRGQRDAENALGGSTIAIIPFLEGYAPGSLVDLPLVLPEHPVAKAIRKVAVRLRLEQERYGAKVFTMSGLHAGVGVSSIALTVAHALKSDSRRVLLLEGKLHNPSLVNTHGGLAHSPGLQDWLSGLTKTPAELIQHDPKRGIDIVVAGHISNFMNIYDSLNNLIETMKEKYDIIIIATENILENDMSNYMASHSDAVIFIGKEDESLYQQLRKSAEIIVKQNVPAISAIMNFSREKRNERINRLLHKQMRKISDKHWNLHRYLRKAVIKIFRISR